MFLALVLFTIGLVFLLKNLGFIKIEVWGIIWPTVIIILAISLFLKMRRLRALRDKIFKRMGLE